MMHPFLSGFNLQFYLRNIHRGCHFYDIGSPVPVFTQLSDISFNDGVRPVLLRFYQKLSPFQGQKSNDASQTHLKSAKPES
jgi:hypothetical protein